MPRPTKRTENARRQYTDQDSFRWTTPDVKVVAQPVDAMVRQRLNKVEDPNAKMAGVVRPVQAPRLPGIVSPPSVSAPLKPISNLTPVMESLSPNHMLTVLNWVSSHGLPAAMEYAEKQGRQQGTEGFLKAQEAMRNGEDPAKVAAEMRPETRLGFAEEAYDSLSGAAMRTYATQHAEVFFEANPEMPVAQMREEINGIYKDYEVGQSIHFKSSFSPHVTAKLMELEHKQSVRLQNSAKEQHLTNLKIAVPGMVESAMKENWPTEDINRGIRDTVSGLQIKGAMLGIDKGKITEATIDALGSWMVRNPDSVDSPEQVFGWTKLVDQHGFTADKVYQEKIFAWEREFDNAITVNEQKDRVILAQSLAEQVAGVEQKLMEARDSGQPVDYDSFKQEIRDIPDYDTQKSLMTKLDAEIKGVQWETDTEVYDDVFLPFLNDDLQNLPSREEIMSLWEDRRLSTAHRDKALNLLSTAASPFVTKGRKEAMSYAKDPADPTPGITAPQRQAAEYFDELIMEATQRNGGIPSIKEIREITKEAADFGKAIKGSFYNSPEEFFLNTKFKGNRELMQREYLAANPDATVPEFETELLSYEATLEAAVEAERRAMMNQYKQPIGPENKDQVSPYQPVEPAKKADMKDVGEYMLDTFTGGPPIFQLIHDGVNDAISRVMSDFQSQRANPLGSRQSEVTTMSATEPPPLTTPKDPYIQELATQENAPIANLPDDAKIMPNVAPEKGGGMDIGFGHKITKQEAASGEIYGINFKDGITKEEAYKILEMDKIKHTDRAMMHVGEEVYEDLPKPAQDILTDLSFTGTLHKFPKLIQAILDRDFEMMKVEYKRHYTKPDGTTSEMTNRNRMLLALIKQYEEEELRG